MMYQENVVLCGSSAYEKKYYFNEDFSALPERVQEELQIMCVLFTEDVGGVLTLEFDDEGNLDLKVSVDEDDILFDDIGSALKIKQLQMDKRELFESLEMFYKVFFLGEELDGEDDLFDEDGSEDAEEFWDSDWDRRTMYHAEDTGYRKENH